MDRQGVLLWLRLATTFSLPLACKLPSPQAMVHKSNSLPMQWPSSQKQTRHSSLKAKALKPEANKHQLLKPKARKLKDKQATVISRQRLSSSMQRLSSKRLTNRSQGKCFQVTGPQATVSQGLSSKRSSINSSYNANDLKPQFIPDQRGSQDTNSLKARALEQQHGSLTKIRLSD